MITEQQVREWIRQGESLAIDFKGEEKRQLSDDVNRSCGMSREST